MAHVVLVQHRIRQIRYEYAGFEVLTAVSMKSYITPCSPMEYAVCPVLSRGLNCVVTTVVLRTVDILCWVQKESGAITGTGAVNKTISGFIVLLLNIGI
jgi:hypothetical protein